MLLLTSSANGCDSDTFFTDPILAITGYLDILLTSNSNDRDSKYFN